MTSDKHSAPEIINTQAIDENIERQLADFGGDDTASLPFVDDLYTAQDDYRTFMGLSAPGSSIYHYERYSSRPLKHQTRISGLGREGMNKGARHRFVCSGKHPKARYLVSISENGLDEGLIINFLEHYAIDAPYLTASYHGLLGMALAAVSVNASQLRSPYESACADYPFPPRGETLHALQEEQDVWVPAASPWAATLCAPVRFNRFKPANYDDFLPETDGVVRWQAFKERYRAGEYQSTLPSGVGSVALHRRGSLTVGPIHDHSFSAAHKHPIVVTFPTGTIVLMCINSLDGFGDDRYSPEKSPLLDWALAKMQHRGGLGAIFRHGLQRTVYALLAEEVVTAKAEARRPKVPWVSGEGRAHLPVILDSEVISPRVDADDVFGHMLQNLLV